MKKCNDINFCCKICLTIITVIIILVAIGTLIAIWCCKNCSLNANLLTYKEVLPNYDDGIVMVRKDNTETNEYYKVIKYKEWDKCINEAENNDTLYINDENITVSAKTLEKFRGKENITLHFMKTNTKITITNKSKTNAEIKKEQK